MSDPGVSTPRRHRAGRARVTHPESAGGSVLRLLDGRGGVRPRGHGGVHVRRGVWVAALAMVTALAGTTAVVVAPGADPGLGDVRSVVAGSPDRPSGEGSGPGSAGEGQAPAHDPVETHTVWHWNVAGSTLHGGSATDGLVEALVGSVLARGADLVSLNEVCLRQFDAVVAGLAAAGWPQDPARSAAFHPTIDGDPGVCGGEPFGLALASATTMTDVRSVLLPDDGTGNGRALLCAAVGDRSSIRLCTTHITTTSVVDPRSGLPHNVAQLRAVMAELEDRAAQGETVMLAGDLNAQPHYGRMDEWYAPSVDEPANAGNTGRYRELDDTDAGCPGYGEPTALGTPGAAPPCGAGAKVDHVLVRADRVAGPYRADALEVPHRCAGVPGRPGLHGPGACSDHHALVGTVTVRVRA